MTLWRHPCTRKEQGTRDRVASGRRGRGALGLTAGTLGPGACRRPCVNLKLQPVHSGFTQLWGLRGNTAGLGLQRTRLKVGTVGEGRARHRPLPALQVKVVLPVSWAQKSERTSSGSTESGCSSLSRDGRGSPEAAAALDRTAARTQAQGTGLRGHTLHTWTLGSKSKPPRQWDIPTP